jgi:hypothetical protein
MSVDEFTLFDDAAEPTAHARATDPHTSHEAAASVAGERLRASQQAVLVELSRRPHGLTDVELVELYALAAEIGRVPRQSPSGIRSRRHELVEAGLVVDTGVRIKLDSGRRAIVWAAA